MGHKVIPYVVQNMFPQCCPKERIQGKNPSDIKKRQTKGYCLAYWMTASIAKYHITELGSRSLKVEKIKLFDVYQTVVSSHLRVEV